MPPRVVETQKNIKTYSIGDSHVVTDRSTDPTLDGLTKGERTGSRTSHLVWPYVLIYAVIYVYNCMNRSLIVTCLTWVCKD